MYYLFVRICMRLSDYCPNRWPQVRFTQSPENRHWNHKGSARCTTMLILNIEIKRHSKNLGIPCVFECTLSAYSTGKIIIRQAFIIQICVLPFFFCQQSTQLDVSVCFPLCVVIFRPVFQENRLKSCIIHHNNHKEHCADWAVKPRFLPTARCP